MNYLLPERLDRLAREHALGTLHGGARRRFARVVASEPAAARAVADWQRRLGELAQASPAMAPRAETWEAVQRRLFGGATAAAPAPVRAPAPGATGAKAPAITRPSRGWGGWLGGLLPGLAIGAAACIATVHWQPRWLGAEPAVGAVPPSYVGVLDDLSGHALIVTSARRHGTQLTVRLLKPVPVPPGQVLQLWAWSEAAPTPVPVVAWSQAGTTVLALPGEAEALLGKMTNLGVSVEAAPAAAGAAPTTAFVAKGHCAKLW